MVVMSGRWEAEDVRDGGEDKSLRAERLRENVGGDQFAESWGARSSSRGMG